MEDPTCRATPPCTTCRFFKKEWDPHAFGQTTAEKLIEYASDVVPLRIRDAASIPFLSTTTFQCVGKASDSPERRIGESELRSEVKIELNFPPKLRGAPSRLYRRRFLQVNTRGKALAEIYTMHSFTPFSNLKISAKNRQHFFANE